MGLSLKSSNCWLISSLTSSKFATSAISILPSTSIAYFKSSPRLSISAYSKHYCKEASSQSVHLNDRAENFVCAAARYLIDLIRRIMLPLLVTSEVAFQLKTILVHRSHVDVLMRAFCMCSTVTGDWIMTERLLNGREYREILHLISLGLKLEFCW